LSTSKFVSGSGHSRFPDALNLSKREKVMKNGKEEPEVLSIEVSVVIERFIAELAKTNRRIDELEVVVGLQQEALRDAVATLKAVVAGRTDWPRLSAKQARNN
jgi:hypothetical protein